ncbi:MAG: GTPase ObgE, partial [Betaproteobacteria bacterium]
KIDALDAEERAFLKDEMAQVAGNLMLMSGVTGEGVQDVLRALRVRIDAGRLRARQADEPVDGQWQP